MPLRSILPARLEAAVLDEVHGPTRRTLSYNDLPLGHRYRREQPKHRRRRLERHLLESGVGAKKAVEALYPCLVAEPLPWTEARKGHLLTVVVHEDPDGALYDQVHAVGLVAGREDRFAELEGAGLKEPDDERLQSRRQTGEKRQRSQHLLLLALPGRGATATAAGASGADATGGAVQSPGVLSHLCAQRGPTRITRPARARSSTSPRSSDLA